MYISGQIDIKLTMGYFNNNDNPPMPLKEDLEKDWYKEYLKNKEVYKGLILGLSERIRN